MLSASTLCHLGVLLLLLSGPCAVSAWRLFYFPFVDAEKSLVPLFPSFNPDFANCISSRGTRPFIWHAENGGCAAGPSSRFRSIQVTCPENEDSKLVKVDLFADSDNCDGGSPRTEFLFENNCTDLESTEVTPFAAPFALLVDCSFSPAAAPQVPSNASLFTLQFTEDSVSQACDPAAEALSGTEQTCLDSPPAVKNFLALTFLETFCRTSSRSASQKFDMIFSGDKNCSESGVGFEGTQGVCHQGFLVSCEVAATCFDNKKNGGETDVDCGGPDLVNCPRCAQGASCVEDGDCGGSETGCANGKCFDMATARSLVPVFTGFIVLGGLLLASCVLCESRIRLLGFWHSRKRKSKKAGEASAVDDGNHEVGEILMQPIRRGGEANGEGDKSRAEAALPAPEGGAQQEDDPNSMRVRVWPKLAALYVSSKAHAGRVRKDAAILNVNTSVLKHERASIVAKLRTVSLILIKQGVLDSMAKADAERVITDTERAEKLIRGAIGGASDIAESAKVLNDALRILEDVIQVLAKAPAAQRFFGSASAVLKWELADADLMKLQLEVEKELEKTNGSEQEKKNRRQIVMLAHTSFVSAANVVRLAHQQNWLMSIVQRTSNTIIPSVFLMYPWFYLVFFGGMLVVFLAFVAKMGSDSNAELQEGGVLGETFLPVPGYYNLAHQIEQRGLVPLLYGIMHCALYCFCWLPVPFLRGIWRDVSAYFPSSRKYLPIDDMIYFHKLLGIMILSFIFIGASLWISVLGSTCRDDRDARSCIAFDPPTPPGEDDDTFDFDPFVNVLMLRKVVFVLWFPIMPLMHWTRGAAPWFLPSFVKHYWYEICYYAHHFIAHFTFVTAMVCRFEVFYLALITWGLYYFDNIREFFTRTYVTEIVVRPLFGSQEESGEEKTSLIHTDSSGMPTSMKLLIEVPPGFKINAGQIVYLNVPEISLVQWHPFSLASGSHDSHIELQVGIVGDKNQWKDMGKDAEDDGVPNVKNVGAYGVIPDTEIPHAQWQMVTRPTFTYLLQDLLRRRITEMAYLEDPERQADEVKPIKCLVRGPYGSPFTKCFDPRYTGVMIIGAGTGLTAALSVLREVLYRKKKGDRVPKYIWFVWSCRRVDDLLWCWDTLHALLMGALKDEVIKPGRKWSRNSNMLDWLGVTIYVTQADKTLLKEFLARPITLAGEGPQVQNGSDRPSSSKAATPKGTTNGNGSSSRPSKEAVRSSSRLSTKSQRGAEGSSNGGYESMEDEKSTAYAHRVSLQSSGGSAWVSDDADKRRRALAEELHHWLGNERRLLAASMDDDKTHIEKLLGWARIHIDRKAGRGRKMAVCFCGPTGLAHTISSAARKIGTGLEFSADHQ